MLSLSFKIQTQISKKILLALEKFKNFNTYVENIAR